MRRVPVDAKRTDWPRLVAQAMTDAQDRIETMQLGAGGMTLAKLRFISG